MSYSLEPLADDCYENSSVLKNKFNIRDWKQLAAMEQSITSMLIAQAVINIPFENVDFDFYKNLHNQRIIFCLCKSAFYLFIGLTINIPV